MKNIKNKPTVELHDGEFMTIDGVLHSIIARHNFTAPLYHQRGGATFYVFKVINYQGIVLEIYSFDECKTFTFDNY